ncbi:WG repeat-containing protein [Ruminococcaceae bacterium OttesenSCG-928-L11]|nr:WG repeat-containing protein [Ruminococcaceae bacterium OttesenSCG-928-L11]
MNSMRDYPPIEIIKMPAHRYISRRHIAMGNKYVESQTPEILFGRILIENEQGLQGLLDLNMDVALPCLYDEIDCYTDRFIKISRPRRGKKSKRKRDELGRREVKLSSEDLGEQPIDVLRNYEPRYYGALDATGNEILPCDCTKITVHTGYKDPNMDRLIYCMNDRWGVCNLTGKEILPPVFDELEAHILKIEHPELLLAAGSTEETLRVMVFIVRKENVYGAYDIYGEGVIPCEKEKVECFPTPPPDRNAELLSFLEKDQWTIVDFRGRRLGDAIVQGIKGFTASEKPVFLEVDCKTDTPAHRFCGEYGDTILSELRGTIITTVDGGNNRAKTRMMYQDENGNMILEPAYTFIEPIGKRLLAAKHHLYGYQNRRNIYDESGTAVFPQDIHDYLLTNTGKIAGTPYDWDNFRFMDTLLFYDEDAKRCTEQTSYRIFREYPIAAPYYLASTGREVGVWHYGLADGDGNIVLPVEYEQFSDTNDCKADTSFFAKKDGEWYWIRICRE